VDQKELLKITKWGKIYNQTLTDLFNQFKTDTGDTVTSFVEFTFTMYAECHTGSLANEKELPKPKTLH
jgi:hypothetical protein